MCIIAQTPTKSKSNKKIFEDNVNRISDLSINPAREEDREEIREMDRQLRECRAAKQEADAKARRLLTYIDEREGYKVLGFKNCKAYIVSRFRCHDNYAYKLLAASRLEREMMECGIVAETDIFPEVFWRTLHSVKKFERLHVLSEVLRDSYGLQPTSTDIKRVAEKYNAMTPKNETVLSIEVDSCRYSPNTGNLITRLIVQRDGGEPCKGDVERKPKEVLDEFPKSVILDYVNAMGWGNQ